MKKIPTLFKRDMDTKLIYDEITPGCEWVLEDDVIVTRKVDGTSCLVEKDKLYRRFDAKKGRKIPEGFIPCQDYDKITGHQPGWIECKRDNPNDKYHWQAFDKQYWYYGDGTYELVGEKINGNPEQVVGHVLAKHGMITYNRQKMKIGFDELRHFLQPLDIEGLVFYKLDNSFLGNNGVNPIYCESMCKVKKKDFGLKRVHQVIKQTTG